jgi:GNAT superfamily N-acetyltransferase
VNRAELLLECFGPAELAPPAFVFEMNEGDEPGGPVLSHVDLYYRRVVIGSPTFTTLTVAAIGNVCTDPAHRGKGYARALVRRVHAHAREHPGIDYAALFSAYLGLYEPLGYRQPDPERLPDFLVCPLTGEAWPPGRIDTRGEW